MERHRIRCAEVWGGIQTADQNLETSSLALALYSLPCEGNAGGDIYYVSVCGGDRLTRVVIADLQGHGEQVSAMSRSIYEILVAHLDDRDSGAVLSELNTAALDLGLSAMTTASVVSYYLEDSKLAYTFAGHPPALMRRTNGSWSRIPFVSTKPFSNVALGVFADAEFEQAEFSLTSGDRVCLYTDGLTETANEADIFFGEANLRTALTASDALPLAAAKRAILQNLSDFAPASTQEDDLTLLLLEVR